MMQRVAISQDLTNFLAKTTGFALLMAVAAHAWIPIPGIPVPFTLQVMALFLGALILSPAQAAAGIAMYILAGMAGLGVFAGGASLVATGATLGYILGMLLAAPVISRIGAQGNHTLAGLSGLAIVYGSGAAYLALFLHISAATAIKVGILPFLGPDLVKLWLAIALIRLVKSRFNA